MIQNHEARSNNEPLVSIVISNYDGKNFLRDCLSSISKLNYKNVEVIVVDAGSIDGAPEMVETEFPWVRIIRTQRIGIAEAINKGIRESKGDIIVFDLNNDDIVSENWLTPLVRTLQGSKDIGIVCGKRFLANSDEILDSAGGKIILGVTIARGHGKKDSNEFSEKREVDYVAVLTVEREVFKKVGLLDEEYYIYGEDVDFCLRAKKAGYRVIYVPQSVFWHRRSTTIGVQSPRRLYYTSRSRLLMIIKHYPLYKKIPVLFLHGTFILLFYVMFYTYISRGNFLKFAMAQLIAIRDVFSHRSTIS